MRLSTARFDPELNPFARFVAELPESKEISTTLGQKKSHAELRDSLSGHLWCRSGDSNPDARKGTAPSRQRVYQFHHFGPGSGRLLGCRLTFGIGPFRPFGILVALRFTFVGRRLVQKTCPLVEQWRRRGKAALLQHPLSSGGRHVSRIVGNGLKQATQHEHSRQYRRCLCQKGAGRSPPENR